MSSLEGYTFKIKNIQIIKNIFYFFVFFSLPLPPKLFPTPQNFQTDPYPLTSPKSNHIRSRVSSFLLGFFLLCLFSLFPLICLCMGLSTFCALIYIYMFIVYMISLFHVSIKKIWYFLAGNSNISLASSVTSRLHWYLLVTS